MRTDWSPLNGNDASDPRHRPPGWTPTLDGEDVAEVRRGLHGLRDDDVLEQLRRACLEAMTASSGGPRKRSSGHVGTPGHLVSPERREAVYRQFRAGP